METGVPVGAIAWNQEVEDDRKKAKQFFDPLPRRVKNEVRVSIPNEQVLKKTILPDLHMNEDFLAIDLQYNPTKYFPNIHETLAIDFEIDKQQIILYAIRVTVLNEVLHHLHELSLNVVAIEPEEVSMQRYLKYVPPIEGATHQSGRLIDPNYLKVATGTAMRRLR